MFRVTTAKWLRTRDIAHFIYQDPISQPLKMRLCQILNLPKEIEEKWSLIHPLLLEALQGADPLEAALQLGDPSSEFRLLVEWLALHFLEQDPEPPPANLTLEIVRGKFPLSYWKQRDHSSHKALPFWLPENPLCRGEHLSQQILLHLAGDRKSVV